MPQILRRDWLSVPDAVRIALGPAAAYRRLMVDGNRGSWPRAVEQVALGALLLGTSVGIAATGRMSPRLLASTTLAWSWIVFVQFAIALFMIWPRAPVTAARSIELWFAGHLPWTLWLLLLAPAIRALPGLPVEAVLVSMFVPIGWTLVIAAAFSRQVLHRSTRESWIRAVAHQLLIVGLVLTYVAWSAGGWFRLIE